MRHEIDIVLRPEEALNEIVLRQKAADFLLVDLHAVSGLKILKRSVDARSRIVKIHLKLSIYTQQELPSNQLLNSDLRDVSNGIRVLVIGAGPAGLFAALRLIELGIKPILIERGKDVRNRRRDIAELSRNKIVNPDSNYCFGEGGAGTYSDGKLYTRSTKRGDTQKILDTFVSYGASADILIDAHPHIGTNKLPKIIQNIREAIIHAGGEVHFNCKVTDFILKNDCMKGVVCLDREFLADQVILATGHSSRDIFELLKQKNIRIEAKSFAMGVRVEHRQTLIDAIQYHTPDRGPYLPAAAYSLVQQVQGRGVFSFCMCPGGIIAPCATAPGEVVTNGWSPSKRNNLYANSGIVVSIDLNDLTKFSRYGEFAGLRYQQELEQAAFEMGGKSLKAPAQRMVDFCTHKISSELPPVSYQPGVTSCDLHELLPKEISGRLEVAFKEFGRKMKGYYTNEAVIVGVESRSSSPVRIPRNKETMEHIQVKGLYPCAEGAGYAGGIMSAAMDGQKCAEAIGLKLNGNC
jgi:uncharacterized FAD-dependent dehydrogenase